LYNLFIFVTLFLLIIGSIVFTASSEPNNPFFLIIPFIAGAVFLIFHKLRVSAFAKYHGQFDNTEEKINLLAESLIEKKKILQFLPDKNKRASFLFGVSKDLIELIDPEEIFSFLVNTLGELFPQAENVLLFEFNKESASLSLNRSSKRNKSVIKTKKGDVLDSWVLRHNCSLLIEDLAKDFRFDYNKIDACMVRGMRSFILSPLSIDHTILGVARIESKNFSSFSLDDSRFLRNICDLGAVVLEKANFISRTQDLAIKDSLTSLFVKDYFFRRLSEECRRAKSRGIKHGIIMLDIDDFKKINDTYGHIVGDLVLKKLARIILKFSSGAGNVVSRFGGEEFTILVVECDKDKLLQIGERIRKTAEQSSLTFRRKKINFTVSLGATLCPDGDDNPLTITDKVDKLLYKAKRAGKNQLCFSG